VVEIRRTPEYATWERRLRDPEAKARITMRILRLAKGNPGDVEPVGGGVSEMRLHYGPGYRIYFVQRGERVIILLCGGDKATQRKDIEKAKALAAGLED
jgi:putative addiction module killer protein